MTKDEKAVMAQRVLVVDDDEAVMTSIAHIVRHHGFEPVTASDWVGALEAIEQARPEVILLDLSMPHVDGVALLKFIRKQDLSIPVIVVSAFIDADSRVELTRLGVSAFVEKPFTMANLNAEIQRVVGAPPEPLITPETDDQADETNPRRGIEDGDKKRRRERIRRRKRELRKPKMKPKVLVAVAASCVALAILLGILNLYLTH